MCMIDRTKLVWLCRNVHHSHTQIFKGFFIGRYIKSQATFIIANINTTDASQLAKVRTSKGYFAKAVNVWYFGLLADIDILWAP